MDKAAVVCVSHGAYVRNIVYSPMFADLTQRMTVALVLPRGVVVPDEDRHLLRGARVVSLDIRPHRFENAFVFLRKNVFAGRERTQTFNLITEIERSKHPLMYRIASACNSVLGRFPILARLWQKVEGVFITGHEFDPLMKELRPSVLVTANYGTEALEVRLLRSAHRHGVPTLAVVPSWDNLSSKGVIGESPRHLAVWNDIMRGEAKSLYGFEDRSIHVCGGLQFDVYGRPRDKRQCDEVFQRLGIDRTRPYVVIGTITPRYFPKNIEIVDILNDAVLSGKLPAGLQIVVRLHPQVIDDPLYGDNLDEYRQRAAAHSHVKLSIPRVHRWGAIRPPAPDDSIELMTLLEGAAAAVMPASTLAIDACALGTPVIGIGFDGNEVKPYAQSVRRTYDFTHYRRIVELGGLRIAESRDQLIEQILVYLKDRSKDQDGRARIVSSHLGAVDGNAWRRIQDVVNQLAEQGR